MLCYSFITMAKARVCTGVMHGYLPRDGPFACHEEPAANATAELHVWEGGLYRQAASGD